MLATTQRATAQQHQQQDSHIGGTAEVRSPLNMTELTKWDQAKAALFSVLFLTTTGLTRSLTSTFESKLEKRASGQEAWRVLLVKHENNSTQRRRTLMRKLGHSKMEDGQDSDVFFVQGEQLANDLESMGKPISKQRVMDIIRSGMTNEYELIQCQAMEGSEVSLDDLTFTMRNMYVNGLHKSGRQGRGSAMTADAARRDKAGQE